MLQLAQCERQDIRLSNAIHALLIQCNVNVDWWPRVDAFWPTVGQHNSVCMCVCVYERQTSKGIYILYIICMGTVSLCSSCFLDCMLGNQPVLEVWPESMRIWNFRSNSSKEASHANISSANYGPLELHCLLNLEHYSWSKFLLLCWIARNLAVWQKVCHFTQQIHDHTMNIFICSQCDHVFHQCTRKRYVYNRTCACCQCMCAVYMSLQRLKN